MQNTSEKRRRLGLPVFRAVNARATVIEWSVPGSPLRYAHVAEAMGEKTEGLSVDAAPTKTLEAVRQLNANLEIPTLRGLKLDETKFDAVLEKMATDAISGGSPENNSRKATSTEIIALYNKALRVGNWLDPLADLLR